MVDVSCGNGSNKVMICHNGTTICVASTSVQFHLDHGDKLGTCTNSTMSASTVATSASNDAKASSTVNVKAFPNPTRGEFTVQLNNFKASKATVVILSLNGTVLAQKEATLIGGNQTLRFDITNQAHGVYLLKVISTDGLRTEKIVVQ